MNDLALDFAGILTNGGLRVGSDGAILVRKSAKFEFLSTRDLAAGVSDSTPVLCYLPIAFTAHDGSIGVYVQFDGSLIVMQYSGASGYGYAQPVTRDMLAFAKSPIRPALAVRRRFVEQDAATWERYLLLNFPDLLPDINGVDPIQEFAKPGLFARFSKWNYDDWLARHRALAERLHETRFFANFPGLFDCENPDLWLKSAVRIASVIGPSRALPCLENAFLAHLFQQKSIHHRHVALANHKDWIEANKGSIVDPLYDILLRRYLHSIDRLYQEAYSTRIDSPPSSPKSITLLLDDPVDIVYFRDGSMLKLGQRITCFDTRDDGERYQYETKVDQILTAPPLRDVDGSIIPRVKVHFRRDGRDETAIMTKVSDLTDPDPS